MKAIYTCPYCNTENACNCDSCKSSILPGEYISKWTEDGELLICGKCNKIYSPDQALMEKDSIVESVIEQYKERSEVGIKKYNKTLDRDDLSSLEWLKHLQEELMDATLYIEKIIQDGRRNNQSNQIG